MASDYRFILVHAFKHERFQEIDKDEEKLVLWIDLRCLSQPFIHYCSLGQLIEEQLVSLIEICADSLIEVVNELRKCNRPPSNDTGGDFLGAINRSGISIRKTYRSSLILCRR